MIFHTVISIFVQLCMLQEIEMSVHDCNSINAIVIRGVLNLSI